MTGVETQAPAALARELADRLGETAAGPRHQLGRVVAELGEERARALLAATLAIEERGGVAAARRQPAPHARRRLLPPGADPGHAGGGAPHLPGAAVAAASPGDGA